MNGKGAFNEWQSSEKVKYENSKCFKDILNEKFKQLNLKWMIFIAWQRGEEVKFANLFRLNGREIAGLKLGLEDARGG